jgi:hypothetical protein
MASSVALWVPVVSVLGGATIGFLPTYLLERRKERTALLTRWDATLYGLCAEFTSAVRQLLFMAERALDARGLERLDNQVLPEQLDGPHLRLRSLSEQIRLLADSSLQEAARLVQHHAYSVRAVALGGADPHAGEPGYEDPPTVRLRAALLPFYAAARSQLRVLNPADVASDDVRTYRSRVQPAPDRSSPSPR